MIKIPNIIKGAWFFMCDITSSVYRTFKPKTSQVVIGELARIQKDNDEIKNFMQSTLQVLKLYRMGSCKHFTFQDTHIVSLWIVKQRILLIMK